MWKSCTFTHIVNSVVKLKPKPHSFVVFYFWVRITKTKL